MGSKKSRAPQPDADGILRTGIYTRINKGAKPRPYDPQLLERWHNENSRPLADRLRGYRAKLAGIVEPFIERPPVSNASWDAHKPGLYGHINLTGESEYCRQLPEIESGEVEANRARDAIAALRCLDSVEHNLAQCSGPGDCVKLLFLDAYELGRTGERLSIRHFEPDVLARRKSNDVLDDHNAKRPSAADLKREAEAAIESAKQSYPGRVGDDDFIKSKAAESLGIGKRALNKRLAR